MRIGGINDEIFLKNKLFKKLALIEFEVHIIVILGIVAVRRAAC